MAEFKVFKKAIEKQFAKMSNNAQHMFVTDIDTDELWNIYLKSFPEGSNPIFRERTEHDCSSCKQFIRTCGNLVALDTRNKRLISIWDVETEYPYQEVANTLSKYVKSKPISNIFLHYTNIVGTDSNFEMLDSGKSIEWEHFCLRLPKQLIQRKDLERNKQLGQARDRHNVLARGLSEFTVEALETVEELIDQGSIYRGGEFQASVVLFLQIKKDYDAISSKNKQDYFVWDISRSFFEIAMFRNSVIGTLVTDLSKGVDLEKAVAMFESKVAPHNYKRPKPVVSKLMIQKAKDTIEELGIQDSLARRHAVTEDLTIADILFADRSTKKQMDVFDEMINDVPVKKNKSLKKVEKVSIDKFLDDIVPHAKEIEVLFENKHVNNLVSLVAPVYPDAPGIFKWNNNFSWSYNGEVTDSIKERVKNAGGNVDGILRCSLSWFNTDDLDIHVTEPGGRKIYYSNPISLTSGMLDVDMNVAEREARTNAVENITWSKKSMMKEGDYVVEVNNFTKRNIDNVGFIIEVELKGGRIYTFKYPYEVRARETVEVVRFLYTHNKGIEIIKSIPEENISRTEWGINTENFHKVRMIMSSPNYWGKERDPLTVGNKHFFFIMENCNTEKPVRGFYNEFLKGSLNEHRKVFEVLASKMRVENSKDQTCGLGFSTTKRDSVICKVKGSFNRTVEVTF